MVARKGGRQGGGFEGAQGVIFLEDACLRALAVSDEGWFPRQMTVHPAEVVRVKPVGQHSAAMTRRVRQKIGDGGGKAYAVDIDVDDSCRRRADETVRAEAEEVVDSSRRDPGVDWSSIPDDTLIGLFALLNCRERATAAAVCKTWRSLAASASLWKTLDLRFHVLHTEMARSLSGRCKNLKSLKFRGGETTGAIVGLEATGLVDLTGEMCRYLSDATLSMIAARHGALESLQLGAHCEKLTSEAITVIALCCPKLKRLRLSGLRQVNGEAIRSLVRDCPNLTELGFLDCNAVDEEALGLAASLRFLSLAGTRVLSWSALWHSLKRFPNLIGLDVSRTDITAASASQFLADTYVLVFVAIDCLRLEETKHQLLRNKSTILLTCFTKITKELARLTSNIPLTTDSDKSAAVNGLNGSLGMGNYSRGIEEDRSIVPVKEWVEWVLSDALLRAAECNSSDLDSFWAEQGTALTLSLLKSNQEDVQERSATALATVVIIDDETATVDKDKAEAVMKGGGIASLLTLAKSNREGLQSESAKAIANLSVNAEVAKTVAAEGGIKVLASLAKSLNHCVAEEAAGGLWNLSVGDEHKGAIAAAGAIQALVELAFQWPALPAGGEGVLERAAGALANLAADDKCSMEVANAGGVHALVMLARCCQHEGVQEQAARALANLAAHGDSNGNNAAVGRETGSLEALVHLTSSGSEGVRQEAAGALWNLSFDDRNREAIAAAGGVEALVALAQSCGSGSVGLQERAAGALWGLSVSEANSIAIGLAGGVSPLIALAKSDSEDVHETAAGALWNLAFNAGNALRIVDEAGVPALVHLCSFSESKMARFMAALALAYMFDGRMDYTASASGGNSCENNARGEGVEKARRDAIWHIDTLLRKFMNKKALMAAYPSWATNPLLQVAEIARIQEAGHLRCSGAEIGRFVIMLKNRHSALSTCAAFALLQFTMPGGRHASHHASLLEKVGAGRVLRAVAASASGPVAGRVFAKIVLRNLEQSRKGDHQIP